MATALNETEVVLRGLGYNDSEVKRISQLCFHLYLIPLSEQKEILDVIMWQFSRLQDKELVKKYDKVFIENNK
jgi:hypothetical protein